MGQIEPSTTHTAIVNGEDIIAPEGFIFESDEAIASRQVLRVRLSPESDGFSDAVVASMKRSFMLAPSIEVVSFYGPFKAFEQCVDYVGQHVPNTIGTVEHRMLDAVNHSEALVNYRTQDDGPSYSSFRMPIDHLDSQNGAFILGLPNLSTLILQEPQDAKDFLPNRGDIVNRVIDTLGSFDTLLSCSLPLDLLLNSFVILDALRGHPNLTSLELTPPSLIRLDTLPPTRLSQLANTIILGLSSFAQLEALTIPEGLANIALLETIGKLENLRILKVRSSSPGSLDLRVRDVLLSPGLPEEGCFKSLRVLDVGVLDSMLIEDILKRFPDVEVF